MGLLKAPSRHTGRPSGRGPPRSRRNRTSPALGRDMLHRWKPTTSRQRRGSPRGVRGIGLASFLAYVGHEIPTALLPDLLTATLGAPASALGLIEGVSDGLAGVARVGGGALADDPSRRRAIAVAGYTTTATLAAATGGATATWQVGVLRAGAWTARGLRVPTRNALLADVVPARAYGRAYGFERAWTTSHLADPPGHRAGRVRSRPQPGGDDRPCPLCRLQRGRHRHEPGCWPSDRPPHAPGRVDPRCGRLRRCVPRPLVRHRIVAAVSGAADPVAPQ